MEVQTKHRRGEKTADRERSFRRRRTFFNSSTIHIRQPPTLLSTTPRSFRYNIKERDRIVKRAKCRPCATPSTDGNTASVVNSKAVKNGVSSKSTRYFPSHTQPTLEKTKTLTNKRTTPSVQKTTTKRKPNSPAFPKKPATATPMNSPSA